MPGRKHIPIGSDVELDAEITRLDTAGSLPPGGLTGEVLTKASDADGDADWEAGGGGLPDEWTVADGALEMEPTDNTVVPLTVAVPQGSEGEGTNALVIVRDPDSPDTDGNPNLLELSNDGELTIYSPTDTPGTVTVKKGDGTEYVMVTGEAYGGNFTIDSFEPEALVFTVGFNRLLGIHKSGALRMHAGTPPADDGLFDPGDMCIYFDATNGAAKLKIRAKQADGTIVTGEVALT